MAEGRNAREAATSSHPCAIPTNVRSPASTGEAEHGSCVATVDASRNRTRSSPCPRLSNNVIRASPRAWSRIDSESEDRSAVYTCRRSGDIANAAARSSPGVPRIGSLRVSSKESAPSSEKENTFIPPCTAALAARSDAKFARCRSSPLFSRTATDAMWGSAGGGATRHTGVSRKESALEGQPHTFPAARVEQLTRRCSLSCGVSLAGAMRTTMATRTDVLVPVSASPMPVAAEGPHASLLLRHSRVVAVGSAHTSPSSTSRNTTRGAPAASGFSEKWSVPSKSRCGSAWNMSGSETSSSTNESRWYLQLTGSEHAGPPTQLTHTSSGPPARTSTATAENTCGHPLSRAHAPTPPPVTQSKWARHPASSCTATSGMRVKEGGSSTAATVITVERVSAPPLLSLSSTVATVLPNSPGATVKLSCAKRLSDVSRSTGPAPGANKPGRSVATEKERVCTASSSTDLVGYPKELPGDTA
ncbi:hypothetical protein T484DRAFT_2653390 [Baffinella frigidus]|nr:hypothetical protein T484DRAFT_2653390 [Cryptophyta sp. CCMP2293]